MEKKTWWWRFVLIIINASVLFVLYSLPCNYKISRCFWGNNEMVMATFHIFTAILIISIFLFFITDKVFLRWLRFAGVWIVLSMLVIVVTPEHHEGLLSFGGPSKEEISIWMASLFVILSLGKIIWDARRGVRE